MHYFFLFFFSFSLLAEQKMEDFPWQKIALLSAHNIDGTSYQKMALSPNQIEKEKLFWDIFNIIVEEAREDVMALNLVEYLIDNNLKYAQENSEKCIALIKKINISSEFKQIESDIIDKLKNKNSFIHKKFKPITFASRGESTQALTDIDQTINDIKNKIAKLPIVTDAMKATLTGAIDTVKKVLLSGIADDDCYKTKTKCQYDGNQGLINYYSQKMSANHSLVLATLRFSLRLRKLNQEYRGLLEKAPTFDQRFNINLWPTLLAASNNDPKIALSVAAAYGHDVCCDSLRGDDYLLILLNQVAPSSYGDDQNPKSLFFLPGALNGITPSDKIVAKVRNALKFYNDLHQTHITFRYGHHHIYGGMLMAHELLEDNVGKAGVLNLATLVPEALGYAYKKTQTERYLSPDALYLWNAVLRNEFKKINKPDAWDDLRFYKAKSEIELHLAFVDFTEEQHRLGAEFASSFYKK